VSITFQGVEHFFAAAFHDLCVGGRAVAQYNNQVQNVGTKVEEITAAVGIVCPGALVALEVERVAMWAFGTYCALVLAHGTAAKAAQANPTASVDLLTQVEMLLQQNPQLVQQAAALFGICKAA
jgi:hypothetical protein